LAVQNVGKLVFVHYTAELKLLQLLFLAIFIVIIASLATVVVSLQHGVRWVGMNSLQDGYANFSEVDQHKRKW